MSQDSEKLERPSDKDLEMAARELGISPEEAIQVYNSYVTAIERLLTFNKDDKVIVTEDSET
jgi:hypothetical protein